MPTLLALALASGLLVPGTAAAGSFGVGGYVVNGEARADRVGELADLRASLTREEFAYNGVNYGTADDGVDRLRASSIEILGLLAYHGDRPSVADWKSFVTTVATRYQGKIQAWEIMNEVDNAMSGSDYAPYLQASHDALKAVDGGNRVIVSGLTGRSEAVSFWNGLYDAGGGSWFDALGLHPYRDRAPEVVAYNTGDFVGTLELAANAIRRHGGGKTIWLTEFGYRAGSVGDDNQANWLARSYLLARTVPEVEKVIMYRLTDAGGDSWGITGRPAYARYKEVVGPLTNADRPKSVSITSQTVVDPFDGTSGWVTSQSSNAELTVGDTAGSTNGGLKLEYRFHADSAFVQAEKEIPISGEPGSIGVFAKGPETTSVLKLRIKDRTGETFQIDLGKLTSDWRFFNFVFGRDTAITSWGGDGTIDYPIRFNSFIYERMGGQASGTVSVDELQVTGGTADLYAYTFGNTLAYWKTTGSTRTSLCGEEREIGEAPRLAFGIDTGRCQPSTASNTVSASSPPSVDRPPEPVAQQPAATTTKAAVNAERSTVQLSPGPVVADNTAAYTLTVTVRDAEQHVLTDRQPSLTFPEGTPVTASEFRLAGETWTATVRATSPGRYDGVVRADDVELNRSTFVFDPVVPPPLAVAAPAAVAAPKELSEPLAAGLAAVLTALFAGLGALVRSGRLKLPGWLLALLRRHGPSTLR